jgi:hypothetical protein
MKHNQVTASEFKVGIEKTLDTGYTSKALLGSSGQTILLYGEKARRSSISVRLHSSGVELLVCNGSGDFLFYGKYHEKLGSDFISKRFKEVIDCIGYDLINSESVTDRNHIKSIIGSIRSLFEK